MSEFYNDSDCVEMLAEDDINTPPLPAQDSPKNIVNILNDYCIQAVLLKLRNVRDFLSAAEVCMRFQENAKMCFPFKKVRFEYENPKKREEGNLLLFNSAKQLLSLFGPKVKSIECDLRNQSSPPVQSDESTPPIRSFSSRCEEHKENLNLISVHCGETLTELEIRSHKFAHRMQSPFYALKKLKLHGMSFVNNIDAEVIFPELETLEFSHHFEHMEWLINTFPKLDSVTFNGVKLTDRLFIKFQRRNPQVRVLKVVLCLNITTVSWQHIGYRMPNIVEMNCCALTITDMLRRSNIIPLDKMDHLKKLDLLSNFPATTKSICASLIEENDHIEELKVAYVDEELSRMLQKIVSLKVLHMEESPADIVVETARNLLNLEFLHIKGLMPGTSLSTTKQILMCCPKLISLNIYRNSLVDYVNLDEFNSILALATGRVKTNLIYNEYSKRDLTNEYNEYIWSLIVSKQNEWVRFVS